MEEKKGELKTIVILLVVICIVIFSCFASSIWMLREGYKHRTDYIHSFYEVYIFSNTGLEDAEILIPLPAENTTMANMDIVDTIHGNMIRIDLADMHYDSDSWIYDFTLIDSNFSNQENDLIWIYANFSDSSEPVYVTLIKKDWYDTLSFLDMQVDYAGVMLGPYPDSFGTYLENNEYTDNAKVELITGWNQYPLVSGTYNQYAD